MTIAEFKNNFDDKRQSSSDERNIEERSKLTLTIIFVVVILLVLGIQIMPYIYGGVTGHSHTGGGGCAWPYDCESVQNF